MQYAGIASKYFYELQFEIIYADIKMQIYYQTVKYWRW